MLKGIYPFGANINQKLPFFCDFGGCKIVKIARLSSCKNFVSKREFISDAFIDL